LPHSCRKNVHRAKSLEDSRFIAAKPRTTLHALTSAALVLPGLLMPSTVQAAPGDRINFQYGRYEEGARNLYGVPTKYAPISADVLHGSGIFSLTDRTKFSFAYTQDTWSGATPITTTPLGTDGGNRPLTINQVIVGASPLINSKVLLDHDLNPMGRDPLTKQFTGAVDPRSVLVMSSASPETRRQATFGLSHEWNEAAINVSGGFSREKDYKSSFGSIGGRMDFNQKMTTLKLNGGYTDSEIGAILDHDPAPYITKTAYQDQIIRKGGATGSDILRGSRSDWVANVGLTQVLTKNSLIDASIGYTHSQGFLENPYKVMSVIFVNPADLNNSSGLITGDVRALLEQRPNIRNQIALNTKYIHHIDIFNAALHLGYRLSVDDWGVNTHTFDASWVQPLGNNWTLTPRIRYYSQDSANFYSDYLFSRQVFNKPLLDTLGRQIYIDRNNPNEQYFLDSNGFSLIDRNGNPVDDSIARTALPQYITYDAKLLPKSFSSDHRLAGFGALSGGFTLTKRLWKGVELETGFEYYTRASSMQIGGGNSSFADFDYYVANAAIKVDMERSDATGSPFAQSHQNHHAGTHEFHKIPPAGIMFGHMLPAKGDLMVGYRFMLGKTNGNMQHGTHAVIDQTIIDQGCSDTIPCRFTPSTMNMHMHMIDIMYAPTRWLNVMLMPTFMDMDMNLRKLANAPPAKPGTHEHQGIGGHETGAIGDTYLSGLIKLLDIPGHRAHISIGFSAPTGKVDIEQRRMHRVDSGLIHFGMQLGSGTWDFMPSLTYQGEKKQLSWGMQVGGAKRMEDKNKSGYRLGDIFQTSVWGGVDLVPWLTASVRGIYTWQGAIQRDFDSLSSRIGSMDFPQNYGGQFWDIGFGLNAAVPRGKFAGNRFGFEWMQPVSNDFNGFQLDRKGSLAATWSYHF